MGRFDGGLRKNEYFSKENRKGHDLLYIENNGNIGLPQPQTQLREQVLKAAWAQLGGDRILRRHGTQRRRDGD